MESNSLVRMHRDGPTFRPTAANFRSPYDFIHEIRHILEVYGVAKITPPHSFVRGSLASAAIKSDQACLKVFQQVLQPEESSRKTFKTGYRTCMSADYECCANKTHTKEFGCIPPSQLEVEVTAAVDKFPYNSPGLHPGIRVSQFRLCGRQTRFWGYMSGVADPPILIETALPIPGSAFSQVKDFGLANDWNMAALDNHPASFLRHFSSRVDSPPWGSQVFYRMLFSHVPWQSCGICTLHYVHSGTGTTWYTVPQSARKDFESARASTSGPLMPHTLNDFGVPVFRICQHAGDFVVVAPLAQSFILSHGFEIMESAGIGLREWIDRPLFTDPRIPSEFAICKEMELVKRGDLKGSVSNVILQAHADLISSIRSDLRDLVSCLVATQDMPPVTHLLEHFYGIRCLECGHYCYLAWVQLESQTSHVLCVKCARRKNNPAQGYKVIVSPILSSSEHDTTGAKNRILGLSVVVDSQRSNLWSDHTIVNQLQFNSREENDYSQVVRSAWQCFRSGQTGFASDENYLEESAMHTTDPNDKVHTDLAECDPGENQSAVAEDDPEQKDCDVLDSQASIDCIQSETRAFGTNEGGPNTGVFEGDELPDQSLAQVLQPTVLHEESLYGTGEACEVPSQQDPNGLLEKDLCPESSHLQDQGISSIHENGTVLPELDRELLSPSRSDKLLKKLQPDEITGPPDPYVRGIPVDVHDEDVRICSLQGSLPFSPIPGIPCSSSPLSGAPLDSSSFPLEHSTPRVSSGFGLCASLSIANSSNTTSAPQLAPSCPQESIPHSRPLQLDVGRPSCQKGGDVHCSTSELRVDGEELPPAASMGLDLSPCLNMPRTIASSRPSIEHVTRGASLNTAEDLQVVDVSRINGIRRRILCSAASDVPKFLIASDVLAAITSPSQQKLSLNAVHLTVEGVFRYANFVAAKEGLPAASEPQWTHVGDEWHMALSQDDIRVLGFALAKENDAHARLSEFTKGIWDDSLLDYDDVIDAWRRGLQCISAQLSK